MNAGRKIMKEDNEGKNTMKRPKWIPLLGGILAVAVIGGVPGCFNPTLHVPAEGAPAAGVPSAEGPSVDAPGSTGITWEEFTITLRVGTDAGRAVAGPDAGDIQYGGIRNIVQVIAVDAEGVVAGSDQAVRKNDADSSFSLALENLWVGKRYHFLFLTGHRERDYDKEADTVPWEPESQYQWKKDGNGEYLPPTLLAAGFLADQTIPDNGMMTISIPMKPLVVDTVFTYGGVTAQAALGGTELPSEVNASLAWTITGDGLAMLVDAQSRSAQGDSLTNNWGVLNLAEQKTILRINGKEEGGIKEDDVVKEAPAVLSGAGHNRIVLDLGARDAEAKGSANFKLTYHPLGKSDPPWIIRNGVNDEAQDAGTVFPNPSASASSPWGTVYNAKKDTYNGNGAVAFGWAQGSVDLTGFVPAPSVGATPITSFFTSQYIGKVSWIPNHSTFQAGVEYRALVTLEPAAGFVFSSLLKGFHRGAVNGDDPVFFTHEYDLSAYVPVPVAGGIPQKQGAYTWGDYSTDKWTIKAWWYSQNKESSSAANDGEWKGGVTAFAGNTPYAAAILLTAKKGYSFDEGIDFKYPTYNPGDGTGPVRGYYKFNPASAGKSTADWLWQNAADHTSPSPKYDKARIGYYGHTSTGGNTNSIETGYPSNLSSKLDNQVEKEREVERLVLVGFNTQDTVPVPKSSPSGGPEGGVRVATFGFATLGIPANVDSGGATFSEALAMIDAAKEAGYLSLKLNGLTTANTAASNTPDISVGTGYAFSTANSPPSVVIDGGNRVVGYAGYDGLFSITVGSGVSLTLRNITLQDGKGTSATAPFVLVEAGGVLILEEGAVIRGHTNNSSNGGGVYVEAGGTLIMKGGEISGNTTNGNGGAVHVAGAIPYVPAGPDPNTEPEILAVPVGGAFTMQGGTISGNNATNGSGGAVYVGGPRVIRGQTGVSGGTFNMQGGTISGNTATNGRGGGVYVAGPAAGGVPGGTFVKSNGAIYGDGAGNANTASGSGTVSGSGIAVYVQGGRYRDDTVVDFLDSGKTITAGGWDYPEIKHTYYKTAGTDGTLEAGQVNWYAFTAPGGGAPLSVEKISGPDTVKVSAYRAYGAPIPLEAAPPAFAAGETVYVKVEGDPPDSSGDYSIRQGPLLLISNSNPGPEKANTGDIKKAGQVDWYFFTAETVGLYSVMWEDKSENDGGSFQNDGNVEVSVYGYDATPINGLVDVEDGYKGGTGVSIGNLDEGETIYVKAVGTFIGKYRIRYIPQTP
jgi:hypothetical protein